MPAKNSMGMGQWKSNKNISLHTINFNRNYLDIFTSLIKVIPGQTALYSNNKFKEYVYNIAKNKKYNAVYTYTIRSIENIPFHLLNYNKFILDLIDPPSQGLINRGGKSIFLFPFYIIEYFLVKLYEWRLGDIVNKTVLISKRDKKYISQKPKKIFIIPHYIRKNKNKIKSYSERIPNAFCFTGNLSYNKNLESINFIVTKILPNLLLKNKIYFHIIGSNSELLKKKYRRHKYIKVISNPRDMLETLSNYRVSLSPQTINFGCISKIPESITVHTPIITSKINFEGANAEKKFKELIAENPNEYVTKINNFLYNKKNYDKFKKKAKVYINDFSISKFEKKLFKLFK